MSEHAHHSPKIGDDKRVASDCVNPNGRSRLSVFRLREQCGFNSRGPLVATIQPAGRPSASYQR